MGRIEPARPAVRHAAVLAVPLCAGVVAWLQALHAAVGATEHAEPPFVLHWARDAALALPLVLLAVWAALAAVARARPRLRPDQEATLTVVGSAAVASYVLAVGSPAHALLFSAHEGAAQAPLALHIARDTVMALPAGVVISAAVVRLRDRRPAPTRHADAAAGDANLRLTRRRVVQAGVAGGVGLLLPFEWVRTAVGDSASPAATPFVLPLPLPPAAVPVRTTTADLYTIDARVAESRVFPTGPLTRIWAYDGHSPGPTILAEAGRTAEVTFHNGLVGEREPDGAPVELTTHLHGGHQAPVDDGWATDARNLGFTALIPPNESRTYHFPNVKDIVAGKAENGKPLWYHDHLMDLTGFNVYQGLAGAYLIHSAEEDHLSLPGTGADAMENHGYGVVDIPLLFQDRLFNADHSLLYPHEDKGVLGDRFLVNGAIQPFFEVRRRKYRFRIYDGSNRRWYNLALSTGQPFVQVGNEGGLLPAPVARKRLLIAPAERADVVVDFTNAPSTVDLVTVPAGIDEADVAVPLLRFRVADGAATDKSAVPPVLRPHEPLGAATVRRSIRFERGGGQWVVNGAPFDPDRPAFQVKRNTIEEWTLTNNSGGWVHPIHIHDVPFRVVSHGGAAPPPWEGGEKDTVALGHGDTATVRLQFIDFTGAYVFHCHNIEHEDMRMMTRFDVVP